MEKPHCRQPWRMKQRCREQGAQRRVASASVGPPGPTRAAKYNPGIRQRLQQLHQGMLLKAQLLRGWLQTIRCWWPRWRYLRETMKPRYMDANTSVVEFQANPQCISYWLRALRPVQESKVRSLLLKVAKLLPQCLCVNNCIVSEATTKPNYLRRLVFLRRLK